MVNFNSTSYEIFASGVDTAVLPIGSTEQHGPHLPISTDILIAQAIASRVSERMGALLLPAIPMSTCREHKGIKGSIWLNSNTFYSIIKDITEALSFQGFKRLILIIAHGGVFIAGPVVREINSDSNGIKLIKVDVANFLNLPQVSAILECKNNLHACEYETSLMLYINESLVRKDKIEDCVPTVPRDYLNYGTFKDFSKNGVWGMPSLGTKEKGEKLLKIVVDESINYINDVNKIL